MGGVCGTLRYSGDAGSSTEAVGGLYWRLEESIKDLESRTGNVMGADGSIFSVRRATYPDFPDSVQDDFTVSMNVIFCGRRLTRRQDALAYEGLVSSSREEFRRKVRIAARAYHTHMHLRPGLRRMGWLDRYKYGSHKLLRWHSATWLALGAVALAVAVAGQLGILALGIAVAAAAHPGRRHRVARSRSVRPAARAPPRSRRHELGCVAGEARQDLRHLAASASVKRRLTKRSVVSRRSLTLAPQPPGSRCCTWARQLKFVSA